MVEANIVDGKVKYMLKTFDGSYVCGVMPIEDARPLLSEAIEDTTVPGYGLVKEPYRFEHKEIVIKLNRKSKKVEE